MKKNLTPPHGGKLKSLLLSGDKKEKAAKQSKKLFMVKLNSLEFSDLIMLAIGAFSPLDGFMSRSDYKNVLGNMKLSNGILWPIPVTLSVSREEADKINEGRNIALTSPDSDEIVGTMKVGEKYTYDKKREAKVVFGTNDKNHPGVKRLYQKKDIYIGGLVEVFSEGDYPEKFPEYARPEQVREIFIKKGWKTITAFQTRNPIHRSHEYLTKVVLEISDGIFIHPIVGRLKEGDIPADIRMKCYEVLINNYYPKDRVVLKVYPMEMRYAGPKEAVLHAIIRQNFGCSHIVIGRDHAGVGDYYGPFDAQNIFDKFSDDDLKIRPVKIDWTFWCKRCGQMASSKTCPHKDSDHVLVSGTKLREMLSAGIRPPEYITRREVSDILIDYYKNK